MENVLVKRTPQRLIIGKPISQYASYSARFCPLCSNISKEQHEKHRCNPSSHYGKYGEYSCETRTRNNENIALLKGPDPLFTAEQCGKSPVAHESTTADFSLYHGKFIYKVEE